MASKLKNVSKNILKALNVNICLLSISDNKFCQGCSHTDLFCFVTLVCRVLYLWFTAVIDFPVDLTFILDLIHSYLQMLISINCVLTIVVHQITIYVK